MRYLTNRGSLHGESIGFGLVLGLIIWVFVFVLNFTWPDQKGMKHPRCLSNLRQLGMAVSMYCEDFDGRFPMSHNWNQVIEAYGWSESILICPALNRKSLPTYAMNSLLQGMSKEDVAMPDRTILLFESIPGENLAGGHELLPPTPRHKSQFGYYYAVCYADGRAEWVGESRVDELNWRPDYEEEGYVHPSMR